MDADQSTTDGLASSVLIYSRPSQEPDNLIKSLKGGITQLGCPSRILL